MTIKVKLSMPGYGPESSLSQFLGNSENTLKNLEFYINDNSLEYADFWFVFEDINTLKESCNVKKNNTYYLNTETSYKKDYFLSVYIQEYLDQFSHVYTPYFIGNKSKENTTPFLPWMINSNHGKSYYSNHIRDINYFLNLKHLSKPKKISVICSNKVKTENQHLRYMFVKELKNHFGNKLDWFGNGINYISTKWDGISNYKYHIAIENNFQQNIISEKLYDAYLGLSFPLYAGAENVYDYFPKKSLEKINIFDLENSISKIETVISSNLYEERIGMLIKSKQLVCESYNPFYRILDIINNENNLQNSDEINLTHIYSKQFYYNSLVSKRVKIKDRFSRALRL